MANKGKAGIQEQINKVEALLKPKLKTQTSLRMEWDEAENNTTKQNQIGRKLDKLAEDIGLLEFKIKTMKGWL